MYDEFFPTIRLIMDQKLVASFRELFRIWAQLFTGVCRPKFTEWVKEFIPEHLDNFLRKDLGVPMVNFEKWGYNDLDIDDETYLAAFCQPSLAGGFLVIPPPLFDRRPTLWLWRWLETSDIF